MTQWRVVVLGGLVAAGLAGCGGTGQPALSDGGLSDQPIAQLPPKRPTNDPELNAFLDKVVKVYADAKSYRDVGTVLRVTNSDGKTEENRRTFRTLYQRPDRFLLEIETPAQGEAKASREVFWTESGPSTLKVLSGEPPEVKETDMLNGLSLTDPVAKIVPRLLIREIAPGHRRTLDRMEVPELSKELVDVDGRPCHEFAGTYDGADTRAYIDAETLVIRKVVQRASRQGTRAETTITYSPEIDVEIPAEDFAFKPPASAE
jgi:outer membrane lipoprotein-sorting protein